MSLYLGLDSSTQSVTAVVVEAQGDRTRVVFESSLTFDEEFPQFGTRHGVLPRVDPRIAQSSPLLWADAMDAMLARVAASDLDLQKLRAIAGSAQQHGSVYLNAESTAALATLEAGCAPGPQVARGLSRSVAPIWMDSSTSAECAEISAAVGGPDALARHTGSRAFERFSGPQIRKFFKDDRRAYASTHRIHLVSSYLASLLIGSHAPLDPGDASGMNLMDLTTASWWPEALEATAPALQEKLPPIVPAATIAGRLSSYWRARHGLPQASIVVWSGDNPSSLIGTGLVREGLAAISLGTSDTIFGLMETPRIDSAGTGHVFGAPTGAFMGLTCFANGSLARERVRAMFGLTWADFSRILAETPAGNHGRVLLPWFDPEITPTVTRPGAHRYDLAIDDGPGHVRGVIEAQLMSMALHSQWMGGGFDTIHATGGASANREILQVMADVFGATVYEFAVRNSAALGAALRARHADARASGENVSWGALVGDVASPLRAHPIVPDPARHDLYRAHMRVYAAREAHALGQIGGP